MAGTQIPSIERIIAATINEKASGDPDALAAQQHPEQEALLRLIGASILNPRGAKTDDEPLAVNTSIEWSDAEMKGLGEMLVRGVSIEEIARRLRRDHGDVRDKVAEVGRACHPTVHQG